MKRKKISPTFIDLFAGCGGLSEGFIREGFTPIAHVEMDEGACNTLKTRMAYHWLKQKRKLPLYYKYLRGNISREDFYNKIPDKIIQSVICETISEKTTSKIIKKINIIKAERKIDIIIGGPPCQAYSLVGRSRDKNRMKGDSRNYLYIQYARFIEEFKPQYFIFENVEGLLSAKTKDGERYFKKMMELFQSLDYSMEYKLLNSSDFGVLQKRKRIIIIGKKGTHCQIFPDLKEIKTEGISVSEIFKDLAVLQAGTGEIRNLKYKQYNGSYLYRAKIKNSSNFITWHIARPHTDQDKEIYNIAIDKWNNESARLKYNDLPEKLKTHKNRETFSDRFKVVAGNLAHAHTIVAHISKDGHYYIHPDKSQNRSLTPREAARLQSFPDNYFFEGPTEKISRTSAYRQIGNAVPVLLAEAIAKGLNKDLK